MTGAIRAHAGMGWGIRSMPVQDYTAVTTIRGIRMKRAAYYAKAILTAVGFAATVITQIVLPNPSPTWIAIQGVATALVVLIVPNGPKPGTKTGDRVP